MSTGLSISQISIMLTLPLSHLPYTLTPHLSHTISPHPSAMLLNQAVKAVTPLITSMLLPAVVSVVSFTGPSEGEAHPALTQHYNDCRTVQVRGIRNHSAMMNHWMR